VRTAREIQLAEEMRDCARWGAARYPDTKVLVTDRGSRTYQEFYDRSQRLAAVFARFGACSWWIGRIHGHARSRLFFDMRLATYEAERLCSCSIVSVPRSVLIEQLRSVSPKLLVYDANLFPFFPAIAREALPDVPLIVGRGSGEDYEGLLQQIDRSQVDHPIGPSALCSIGFTSGTTGQPKGVAILHRGLVASTRMLTGAFGRTGVRAGDGFFVGVPLFAAGGGMVGPAMAHGLTLYVPDRFEAATLARLADQGKLSLAFVTPSQLIDLLDLPDLDHYDFSRLKAIVYGSAATPGRQSGGGGAAIRSHSASGLRDAGVPAAAVDPLA
jgi:fatty-acyl-CoA synthase